MNAKQFNDALLKLGLSVYAGAPLLGISLRQAQRYSSGEQVVAKPLASFLRLLIDQVQSHKDRQKQLYEMLAVFLKRRGRISNNHRDVTAEHVLDLHRMIAEIEGLLLRHPAGLPPQMTIKDPLIFQFLAEASADPLIFGVRSTSLRAVALAEDVKDAMSCPLSKLYLHFRRRLEQAALRIRREGLLTAAGPYEISSF